MTDEELQLRRADLYLSLVELRSLLRVVVEKHAQYPPGKVGWSPELYSLERRIEEGGA